MGVRKAYLKNLHNYFLKKMSNDLEKKQEVLQKDDETNEKDPVIKMFKNIGCVQEHYAVQKCMDETRKSFIFISRKGSYEENWEQCAPKVDKVFDCFRKNDKHLRLNFYKQYFFQS